MINARIRDEAALWMARARDPRFSDWDGLTEWLEADPAHNLAYEAAFAAHDLTAEAPLAAPPQGVSAIPAPVRTTRHVAWWAGGGIGAAAAAAALFVMLLPGAGAALMVTETAPGEQRTVTLDDGTRIALNGGSRLVLNAKDNRTAKLER